MIVDCEMHPGLKSVRMLLPYLDSYWTEMVEMRGIGALTLSDYPTGLPMNRRPDAEGDDADALKKALAASGADVGIGFPLFGGAVAANPYFSAALCTAANDWQAVTLSEAGAALKASVLLPMNNIPAAVAEIEARAGDPRFVQAAVYAGSEMPLGRMENRPVFEAAAAAGFPIAIHPGGFARAAPTPSGWPSFLAEHHANLPSLFEVQLLSLVFEGTFTQVPGLRVILLESGVTWLPQFLWRIDKLWKGTRPETPWVDQLPSQIVRDHVFATLAPFDSHDPVPGYARLCEEAQTGDMWLYGSDFPHWHSEMADPLAALPPAERVSLCTRNPMRAYPRLKERAA